MSKCDICLCQTCFDNEVLNGNGTCSNCDKCNEDINDGYHMECDNFDDEDWH